MKQKQHNWIAPTIIIVFIIGVVLTISSQRLNNLTTTQVVYCLNNADAKLYAHITCSHCKAQKALFKDDLRLLNVIECSTNEELCKTEEINAYPTWEINGRKYLGEKSLEELYLLCN
ncbi:hypothetical protein JXM83_01985 [Candidatus Woesearchaeota archaeon]|nr:hypothetical protein [Candidatus Woesearchaeota archaeon]